MGMEQIIEHDGHMISVQMNTPVYERLLKYSIDKGQTLQYRNNQREIISAEATWSEDGQRIVINCKVYAKGVNPNEEPDKFKERTEVRYLKKSKMYEEITMDDQTMVRKFRKQ